MIIGQRGQAINNSHAKLLVHHNNSGTDYARGAEATHTPTDNFVFYDSFVYKFAPYSADFDGPNRYTSYADSSEWDFDGTEYYETYFMLDPGWDDSTKYSTPASQWESNASGWHMFIAYDGTYTYTRLYNYTAADFMIDWTFTGKAYADSTWYHMAYYYYAGTYYLHINGLVRASSTRAILATSAGAATLKLGNSDRGTSSWYFRGWLDEMLYQKGDTCPYMGREFTPPNRPH